MILCLVSIVGASLFVWPFLGLGLPGDTAALGLTLAAVFALVGVEAGTRRLDSRQLTLLAAMAAIEAALRLVVVNGIGGFSPVFFLILVAGYAFGPSFGFLLGSFGLLVSGIATGGVGPWLPYEMFCAGWMGAAAGVAGIVVRRFGTRVVRRDIAALVAVAIVTGFAYGALTDTWEWVAFFRDVPSIGWSPELGPAEAVRHFAGFYMATSFAWDTFRAVGDSLAILAFATPVLIALDRMRSRFGFEVIERPAQFGVARSMP